MINLIIILPVLAIFMNLLIPNKNNNVSTLRVQFNLLITLIMMYLIFYLLLTYNNNNIEYQYRFLFYGIILGIDGINLSIIGLTSIIMPILIILAKKENKELLNLILGGYSIIIILLSTLDIFLFYFLFELILIPLFIMIGKYGSEEKIPIIEGKKEITYKRMEATRKFFIYSFGGSLLMLISIIIIYIKYGSTSIEIISYMNNKIFEINRESLPPLLPLSGDEVEVGSEIKEKYKYLFLGILIPLMIKVPIYPLHGWLPLAHSEANTIGSIILAAILLKIGTYGIIRNLIEIFPIEINNYYTPIIYLFSIISIYYGCMSTLREIDIKRIIAYSSIIHMNYSILALFSGKETIGKLGGSYINITHGIVSTGMFILIGILYKRYNTRIYLYYNNLATYMPIFTLMLFLLVLNLIAFPITSSFISELLIFTSIYNVNMYVTILAIITILFNTIFTLWLFNKLSFGLISKNPYINKYIDLTTNEILIILPLILLSYILGINPNILINMLSLSIFRIVS